MQVQVKRMPGPLLDLTVTQPKTQSPLQTIGALANLRDVQSQTQLRDAQQREVNAQAEQRQADIADQNAIQQKMLDPDFARSVAAWDGKSAFPLDGLVRPKTANAYKTHVIELQKQQLGYSADQLADFGKRHAIAGTSLRGLLYKADGTPNDDAFIRANSPGMVAQLVKDKIIDPELAQQLNITDFKSGQGYASMNGYLDGFNESAIKAQQEAAKIPLTQAQIDSANANAANANASAKKTELLTPAEVAKAQTEAHQAALTLAGTSDTGMTAVQQAADKRANETAAEARRHNRQTELTAAAEAGGGKLVSPAEAALLGVPYGTTRAEAAGKQPSTQAQETVANYATRIKQANDQLARVEDMVANQGAFHNWMDGVLPNFVKSGDRQVYEQAQRNFINAILRRESGAVIASSEFDEARKQYFPAPGDSTKVLSDKRNTRDLVLRNFAHAAGNAYTDPGNLSEAAGGKAPPAVGAIVQGYKFKGGNPADPNSWDKQ